jgi:hypothetical protein
MLEVGNSEATQINAETSVELNPVTPNNGTIGLTIDLTIPMKGFDGTIMKYSDINNNIKDMLLRDVLQYSVSSLPPEQDINNLKFIFRLMPRIDDTNTKLVLVDPEEKRFLIEAIKTCKAINPIPKAITLGVFGEF